MVFRNTLDKKCFFLHVAVVFTCFQSEKSQNSLDLMHRLLMKRFKRRVKINWKGRIPNKSHLSDFPSSFCLNLHQSIILYFFQNFPHKNFLEQHWKLPWKHAIMNEFPVQILNRKLMHRWILLAEKLWLHIGYKNHTYLKILIDWF